MNKKPSIWQRLFGRTAPTLEVAPVPETSKTPLGEVKPLEMPPNDPLLAYITSSPGVIQVDKLNFDSPTLASLREAGVKLTLPLVNQGELIGLLNLGPRMSEQEYSSDDYRLLNNLATQASPALRIAQLARQQLAEAQERERIEQELRVGRVIQETLLPKEIPQIEGWKLAAEWKPAREVSGDFYDFIDLPDGRLGIIVADVTDKGVPAALVMATSRSILRAATERLIEPGEVLARANDLLHPDIPPKMFVTCLYLVLDTKTGHMAYANAGHNLPYLRQPDGVIELRATGMPLGLLPGMTYDQKEVTLQPGETVLLSSDGIVEAHNKNGEMYGFPRLQKMMHEHRGGQGLIPHLMETLYDFVGKNYEQEDDITLVVIQRTDPSTPLETVFEPVEIQIPSVPGNERQVAAQVLAALASSGLTEARFKKLETAVAEATMNAMEHGNQYDADKLVVITVYQDAAQITIHIADQGTDGQIPDSTDPNLDAKLAGEQSPRGWGLFLIKNMVDEMNVIESDGKHTIELIVRLEE